MDPARCLTAFQHRHMTIGGALDNKLAIPNNGPRRLDVRTHGVEVAPRLTGEAVFEGEGPLARPFKLHHVAAGPRLPCEIVDERSDVRPARALDIKTEERER